MKPFARNEAVRPPHHLDHEHTIVRVGGVADLVDRVESGVVGGVESNGVIRARNVVVNRARHAHHRELEFFVELAGPGQGAVPADHHQTFQAEFLHVLHGLLAADSLAELGASRRVQLGAPSVKDAAHGAGFHPDPFAGNDAPPAVSEAKDFHSAPQGRPHHAAHGGIHAGGISPTGENSNAVHGGACSFILRVQPAPLQGSNWLPLGK